MIVIMDRPSDDELWQAKGEWGWVDMEEIIYLRELKAVRMHLKRKYVDGNP